MDTFSECNLIEIDSDLHDSLAAKTQFITHLIGNLLVLQEAESCRSPEQLQPLFAVLLMSCELSDPTTIYGKFKAK